VRAHAVAHTHVDRRRPARRMELSSAQATSRGRYPRARGWVGRRQYVLKADGEVVALARRSLLLGLALLVVAMPSAAPAFGGFLSFGSAIEFQKNYFPPVAPPILLKDRRGSFFRTKRPITVNKCFRRGRPTVICHFSLGLHPNVAHRRAHWFPIGCHGKVRSRHRVNGSIVGDVRGYVCRTIFPKK
jgi:hypothetical protein